MLLKGLPYAGLFLYVYYGLYKDVSDRPVVVCSTECVYELCILGKCEINNNNKTREKRQGTVFKETRGKRHVF